jgi:hypothetical protein
MKQAEVGNSDETPRAAPGHEIDRDPGRQQARYPAQENRRAGGLADGCGDDDQHQLEHREEHLLNHSAGAVQAADEGLIHDHGESGQTAAEHEDEACKPSVDRTGGLDEVRPENECQAQADRQRGPDQRGCGDKGGGLLRMSDDLANKQGSEPGLPEQSREADNRQEGRYVADRFRRK